LIHKPTFSGDLDNYDIWCVLDEQYLQKYEPVLLTTGERCHQSADVLAQYTPNKLEFLLVKCEEKGKTENNNIVVSILSEFDPKTNPKLAACLINKQDKPIEIGSDVVNSDASGTVVVSTASADAISTDLQNVVNSTSNLVNTNNTNSNNNTNNNTNSIAVNSASALSKYEEIKSSFDIFVQVLSSQCLNVEFIVKIKEIQDEYFRPSLEFIENILGDKYNVLYSLLVDRFLVDINQKLINKTNSAQNAKLLDLKQDMKYLIDNKPKMLLIENPPQLNKDTKSTMLRMCDSLNYYFVIDNNVYTQLQDVLSTLSYSSYLIKFDGMLYDFDSLIALSDVVNNEYQNLDDKGFLICEKMFKFISLLHSLKHFKFNLYELCCQKVIQVFFMVSLFCKI
jgi:hypothetical protein